MLERPLMLNVTLSKYRLLAQSLSMTGSDLNSSSKPWYIQEKTSSVVYQEFHDQVMDAFFRVQTLVVRLVGNMFDAEYEHLGAVHKRRQLNFRYF